MNKLDGWNGSRLNYDWKCFNDSIRDAVIRWEDLIDNYCWGMMAKFRWWSKYISLLTSYRRKNCIMHFPYKDEIHDAITSTRYKLVRSLSFLDNSREKYILYFLFRHSFTNKELFVNNKEINFNISFVWEKKISFKRISLRKRKSEICKYISSQETNLWFSKKKEKKRKKITGFLSVVRLIVRWKR